MFQNKNGDLITDKSEILNEIFEYYQDLMGNERVKEGIVKNHDFKIKKWEIQLMKNARRLLTGKFGM